MLLAFWQSQIVPRICKGVFCWCGSCLPKIRRELAYFCQFEEWMLGFFPSPLLTAKFIVSWATAMSLLLFFWRDFLEFFFFSLHIFFYNHNDWIMPIFLTAHLLGFPLTHRYLSSYKSQSESLVGLKWTSEGHLLIFCVFL